MRKPPTNESESDFRRHVDDWNFSTETVFRVSKLLEDFRHEFGRSNPRILARVTGGDDDPGPLARLPIDFVRRVFTSPEQDGHLITAAERLVDAPKNVFGAPKTPFCFQFTGSSAFERFRDEHRDLRSAFNLAIGLLQKTLPSGECAEAWAEITGLYREAYRDLTLIGVLDQIESEFSKIRERKEDEVSPDEQFRLLSLLFVFYSRLNIAGEASATLAAAHFSDGAHKNGRPDTFAYLLESNIAGEDVALLKVDSTGMARPVGAPLRGERPAPLYFPDCGKVSQAINHARIRRQIFYNLYLAFNPTEEDVTEAARSKRRFHLVIPVYEIDDRSRLNQEHIVAGPFLGWLYIQLNPTAIKAILGLSGEDSWEGEWHQLCSRGGELATGIASEIQQMRFALNRFSELYLLGEMEWAIEQPWMAVSDAARFTTEHYYHCDGWMEDGKRSVSPQALSSLKGEYSVFCNFEEGRLQVEPKAQEDVTHIIVDVSRDFDVDEDREARPVPIILKRRPATAMPIAWKDREFYRRWLTGNVRQFYAWAKMREVEQKSGQRSGMLASAHDYSKDIGPILSQLSEYGENIRASMGIIHAEADRLTGLPAPAEEVRSQIMEELKELQAKPAPRFGWFAATRFLNAHLVTQTRGVLLPEPIECVKMLENGNLADLEEIVRLLVWHPVTIQELKDRERKFSKWAPDKLRLSSTWWTLFSFDLDPSPASLPFREKLGQRVCTLILDEKIDQTAFAERFHVPQVRIVNDHDEPVCSLWPDGDADRWRPLDGLLPLFVFTMRLAFQSAWAKTILQEPEQPLAIQIVSSKRAERKNEFHITFPSLTSPENPLEDQPYFREWDAQIAHYRGTPVWKSSPWKVVAATTPVTHELWGDVRQITLTAAI